MNRSHFALALAGILAAAAVLLSPVACTMHKQNIIREGLRAGENPILVRCALESLNGDAALAGLCAAAAARVETSK